MPIVSISLFAFVAVYTLFFALPHSIYTIRLSLNRINVSTDSQVEHFDPSVRNGAKFSHYIDASSTKTNKAIISATLGLVIPEIIRSVLAIGLIQTISVSMAVLIVTLSIVLIIIPKIIYKRKLMAFKKSKLYTTVVSVLNDSNPNETPTLNVGQKFEIVNLIEQHYDTRPDIIVAGLLCSQHEHIRKEVERAIKRHGFTGLIINITNIDDDVLNELNTLLSHKEIHDLIPTGPYLNEIKSHHIENSAVFEKHKAIKLSRSMSSEVNSNDISSH